MKRIHLLRTAAEAAECRPLLAAAADLGLRVGWLNLESIASAPPELEEPAALGAFRAVSAGGGQVVTVKRVRGALVMKDLLREHFAGCRLVVIRGDVNAPELTVTPSGFQVRFEDGAEQEYSAEALARALRRSRLQKRRTAD
jgi:hypothetical protein